jgi:hypothetical protein
MKKANRLIAFAASGFMLAIPAISSAANGSITTTGPNSDNVISTTNDLDMDVENTNTVTPTVTVDQTADSGEATVDSNTTVGALSTGSVMNDNMVDGAITVDNSKSTAAVASALTAAVAAMPAAGSNTIDKTGPSSDNTITVDNSVNMEVENKNKVDLKATVTQDATSGDAEATNNTTVGNVTTGNVTNTSSVKFTLSVIN